MFTFVLVLLVCLTVFHNAHSIYPRENKLDKPLFVPAFNYATLVHLNPLSYGSQSLENAALYPQYVYDHGSQDYVDSLQRQLPYQDIEKRLENFLYIDGKPKKHSPNYDLGEDDYKVKPNNIQSYDDNKPELEDLDRKFKRSLTYTSWTPPTLSSTNNLEDRVSIPNSRAANVPFGPYTTWLPYEGPSVTSYVSQSSRTVKGTGHGLAKKNRRRRDVILEDDDNHFYNAESSDIVPPHSQSYGIPISVAYPPPVFRSVPLYPDLPYVQSPLSVNTLYSGKLPGSVDMLGHDDDVPVPIDVYRK